MMKKIQTKSSAIRNIFIGFALIVSMVLAVTFLLSNFTITITSNKDAVSSPSVTQDPEITETEYTDVSDAPYDRKWFESRKANTWDVIDDFGVICTKTIRYELMKRQSTVFIWNDDCKILTATVQDWYTGEWHQVSGLGSEFETEHVVPFSLLFDAFGRYIQAEGDQELGYELYYSWDNMVAATKSLNAAKSDRIGPDVMTIICPVVEYKCAEWDSEWANTHEYTKMSIRMWEKWENIAQKKGWG